MISPDELRELESTLLPTVERHHLRLLAHGLRTLQEVAGRRDGPLPHSDALAAWAARQPAIAGDPAFRSGFVAQMERLGAQLTAIADGCDRPPLALDLDDLVAWARRSADQRLNPEARQPPPSPPPAVG